MKECRYSINRWLVRFQSLSGYFGKENKSLALPGIRTPVRPNCSIDTITDKVIPAVQTWNLGHAVQNQEQITFHALNIFEEHL